MNLNHPFSSEIKAASKYNNADNYLGHVVLGLTLIRIREEMVELSSSDDNKCTIHVRSLVGQYHQLDKRVKWEVCIRNYNTTWLCKHNGNMFVFK